MAFNKLKYRQRVRNENFAEKYNEARRVKKIADEAFRLQSYPDWAEGCYVSLTQEEKDIYARPRFGLELANG